MNDPGFASSANGSGRTTFERRFVVEERSEYAIAVALEAELIELRLLFDGVSATGSALASFELRGGRSGTLLALELEDVLSDGLLLIDSLAESGFLEPDTYQITVVVSAQLDGVANALGEGAFGFGFGFDLIVVPEPSSAALQASALVALALVARLHGRRWENGARTRTGPARSLRS